MAAMIERMARIAEAKDASATEALNGTLDQTCRDLGRSAARFEQRMLLFSRNWKILRFFGVDDMLDTSPMLQRLLTR